jgi:hypothetical protein
VPRNNFIIARRLPAFFHHFPTAGTSCHLRYGGVRSRNMPSHSISILLGFLSYGRTELGRWNTSYGIYARLGGRFVREESGSIIIISRKHGNGEER